MGQLRIDLILYRKNLRRVVKIMIYNALDIAAYIVVRTEEVDSNVSTIKMQSLLYFCQAYFLMKKGEPCFNDDIIATNNGPMIDRVWNEFKKFGAGVIPKSYISYHLNRNPILKYDEYLINDVLYKFDDWFSTQMLNIIFDQKPFKDALKKNKPISIKHMKKYFR